MDNTVEGGCYLAADGVTYIDANGKPVTEENLAKFKEMVAENGKRQAAIEAQLAAQNLTPAQALAQILRPQAAVESTEPKAKK